MDMIKEATHISRQAAERKSAAAAKGAHGEYLTFRLGEEEYGIDILRVQEIRSYESPTRNANTPEFLRGVVQGLMDLEDGRELDLEEAKSRLKLS